MNSSISEFAVACKATQKTKNTTNKTPNKLALSHMLHELLPRTGLKSR